jgi:hypothetical protein
MFRRTAQEAKAEDEADGEGGASEPETSAPETTDLRFEIQQVREQLEAIERSLSALAGRAGREPPAPAP